MNQQEARNVWLTAAEKVKDRVLSPTLYRAVELGIGITLDGSEFILGFSSADMPMAGHLRSSQHKAIIEQCLSEVIKKKVRLKIVEGTTLADYENYKRLQEAAEETRVSMSERRQQERMIELAWDETAEKITRGYAKLEFRQFAQSRAAFIRQAFCVINEAVNKFDYSEKSDEIHKRSLARVFEKFATCVDVPSSILAYEFFRLREEGKLK